VERSARVLPRSFIRSLRLLALGAVALSAVSGGGAGAQEEEAAAAPPAAAPTASAAAGAPAASAAAESEGGDDDSAGAAGDAEVPEPKGETVTVGLYINDLQTVDVKSHSYEADVYIWFRWTHEGLDPATTLDIINPNEQWGHMITPIYEEPEQLENGEYYQVVRIQGRFSRKMPLYNYPFDKQILVITMEDSTWEAGAMRYVLDEQPVTQNAALNLPGYHIGEPRLVVETIKYPTRFGDLRLSEPADYSRVRLEVPIDRPKLAYAMKLFLPLICVVLCATLMFLLAPAYVDSRVDVGITSLLTIVALQMTFNQDVPDVGYLMLMDKVYICAYLFVIAALLVVVQTTRLVDRNEVERARKLHLSSLSWLLVGWSLATLVLVIRAIQGG
jgi:hypothetical protein